MALKPYWKDSPDTPAQIFRMRAMLEYYYKTDTDDWSEEKIGDKFAKLAYVLEKNSQTLNMDG